MSLSSSKDRFYNPKPDAVFESLASLIAAMQVENKEGADFIQFLSSGDIKEGKAFWRSQHKKTFQIYQQFLQQQPELKTENPYQFLEPKKHEPVIISDFDCLSDAEKKVVNTFHDTQKKRIVFSGGPAPKIAAVLSSLNNKEGWDIRFIIDSACGSNESSSASYLHINHANALNSELENTGFWILPVLIKRNIFGEKNIDVALSATYKKVDLWLKNVTVPDMLLFISNTVHALNQRAKLLLGIKNEHDKSRLASFKSSKILAFIETTTKIKLTLKSQINRALVINFDKDDHEHSDKENQYLSINLGLKSHQLSKEEIAHFYSEKACESLSSVVSFADNGCVSHGFDGLIEKIASNIGFTYQKNKQITEVCIKGDKAVAIWLTDTITLEKELLPITSLGLSLGPKVKYRYKHSQGIKTPLINKYYNLCTQGVDATAPIGYQTLATGISCQILFKITDPKKFTEFPFTSLKQTHFVEIASNDDFVLVKLTGGGNIGTKYYSRSYGINALANMLRVITPESGLTFYDVVSAWPCSRGTNASNNGQLVRLSDNFVIRFAEGGTGMSKMASNAQIMLDMLGLDHGLDDALLTKKDDYAHTIIDHRKKTKKVLAQ